MGLNCGQVGNGYRKLDEWNDDGERVYRAGTWDPEVPSEYLLSVFLLRESSI